MPHTPCRRFEALQDRVLLDGPQLDAEEQAFVAEHRETCSTCAISVSVIEMLEGTPPAVEDGEGVDFDEVARAVQRRGEDDIAATGSRSRRWIVALAMAAAVAVALVMIRPSSRDLETTADSAAPASGGSCEATVGEIVGEARLDGAVLYPGGCMPPGDALIVDAGSVELALADGSRVQLDEGTRLAIAASDRPGARLQLTAGRAEFEVEPQAEDAAFVVATPEGDIRVVGTRFEVSLPGQGIRIQVSEGSVVFEPTTGPATPLLPGDSFDSHAPISEGQDLTARLDESPAEGAPGPEEEVETGIPEADDGSHPEHSRIAAMLDDARSHRNRGEWDAAVDAYAELIETYPESSDAETCRVAMGEIQLKHLGAPQSALESFQSYIAGAGHAALLEEAEWGAACALEQLGEAERERGALRDFVAHHPDSLYAPRARTRLESLEGGSSP